MPRFRSISVHPTTVLWGFPWSDDPDSDAFSRLARGICEVYSDTVAGAGVQHTVSSLRLHPHDEPTVHRGVVDEGQTVVESPVDAAPVREFFEIASVRVVRGFAELEPDLQRQVVVEAVHAAGVGLARCRGLPVDVFEAARSAVLDAGPDIAWSTPWTPSPDGRWRARCSFRTLSDGFGRQVLEVSTEEGGTSIFSSEVIASAELADQCRAGASLRWKRDGRVQVSLCTGFRGPGVGVLAVHPVSGTAGELSAPGSFHSFAEAAAPADDVHRSPTGSSSGPRPRLDVLLVLPDPLR